MNRFGGRGEPSGSRVTSACAACSFRIESNLVPYRREEELKEKVFGHMRDHLRAAHGVELDREHGHWERADEGEGETP